MNEPQGTAAEERVPDISPVSTWVLCTAEDASNPDVIYPRPACGRSKNDDEKTLLFEPR